MAGNANRGGPVLYDMTSGSLTQVPKTTFATEAVLERQHLQAAVRDRIEVLGEDLLVVAEGSASLRTHTAESTFFASTAQRGWWWSS